MGGRVYISLTPLLQTGEQALRRCCEQSCGETTYTQTDRGQQQHQQQNIKPGRCCHYAVSFCSEESDADHIRLPD